MRISPKKNSNFEKPSRNLSIRTKEKILKKKFLDISQKKFGSAYAQSPRKCSNIEILAKIEGKEANFFSKIYERHIRIWFRSKKNSKLSHACVPLIFFALSEIAFNVFKRCRRLRLKFISAIGVSVKIFLAMLATAIHSGLICVKTLEPNIQDWAPLKGLGHQMDWAIWFTGMDIGLGL